MFLLECFAFWYEKKVVSDTGGVISAAKWGVLSQFVTKFCAFILYVVLYSFVWEILQLVFTVKILSFNMFKKSSSV